MSKLKLNDWLSSEEFLSKIDFYDKYYFNTLVKYISNYIKNIPITVGTTWDPKNKNIYFLIGDKIKKPFKVSPDIFYDDFIFQVNNWLYSYFPKYRIEYPIEVELTDEEILSKVHNEGMNLNDALSLRKSSTFVEKGIIERIHIMEDTFFLKVNNITQKRISGTLANPLPLSRFLKEVKNLYISKQPGNVIRDYIFNNSISTENELEEDTQSVMVNYLSMQMYNFFVIRSEYLKDLSLNKIADRRWSWGKYIVIFENDILEKDCINYAISVGVKVVN